MRLEENRGSSESSSDNETSRNETETDVDAGDLYCSFDFRTVGQFS